MLPEKTADANADAKANADDQEGTQPVSFSVVYPPNSLDTKLAFSHSACARLAGAPAWVSRPRPDGGQQESAGRQEDLSRKVRQTQAQGVW